MLGAMTRGKVLQVVDCRDALRLGRSEEIFLDGVCAGRREW